MERFEKEPTQGRNIERDKQSFIEAISAHSIEEIPTEFDESASQDLLENIAHTNIFILGEMHGVKENPDVIYTLFKKFNFRGLALEWEPSLKQVVEKYLATGEVNFDDDPEEQHPMGERVKKQIPNVFSGRIEYDSGQFYNLGTREFTRLSDAALPATARFYMAENGIYTFELPEAHVAVVPNPHERI